MQIQILICARLEIILLWKIEKKLNPFSHCDTAFLWLFLGRQSVGMGATRNPILPIQYLNFSDRHFFG